MLSLIVWVLLLAASPGIADGPPDRVQPFKTETFPCCGMSADHYLIDMDEPRQVWLRSDDPSQPPALLTTYERSGNLVPSDDCTLLALNDDLGSNISEVRLFRKIQDVSYSPVTPAQVASGAWKALARAHRLKKVPTLDHTYVTAVAWSSDSKAVLLRVWGHTDADNRVDDWYCVYDVATGRASADLALMNRASVVLNGRTRSGHNKPLQPTRNTAAFGQRESAHCGPRG